MPRARKPTVLLAAGLAGLALAAAGCGGASSAGVAHLSSARGASSAGSARGGSWPGAAADPEQAGVAYARCMRANGVPSFPDPSGGVGLYRFRPGLDPSSPAFRAARAKCLRLMPGAGIGSGPPPSSQTLARFLDVARRMRRHGISGFPDPRTSVPSDPFHGGTGVISDIEGAILVFPSTIDERSPAFGQAASACAFPLHNR
jgi:hypothetical protein